MHGMEKEAGGGEADACVAPLGCECGREPDMVCGICEGYWDGGVIMEAAEYTYLGVLFTRNRSFTKYVETVVLPAVRKARGRLREYYVGAGGLGQRSNAVLLRALVEPTMMYGAAAWAPLQYGTGGAAPGRVGKTVAASLEAAYNIAARTALGMNVMGTNTATYGALGVPSPKTAWATAVMGYVDKTARMQDGRMPKVVLHAAFAKAKKLRPEQGAQQSDQLRRGTGNSYGDRIVAAYEHLYGRTPTKKEVLYPEAAKTPAAEERKEAAKSKADEEWEQYVQGQWGDGGSLYVACPPPSQNDYLRYKRHGQYAERKFQLLIQMRTYSHGLMNHGGRRAGLLLKDRVCMRCNKGEVETEVHHVWNCPGMADLTDTMVKGLGGVYPGIAAILGTGKEDTARMRTVFWDVPDGRYGGTTARVGGKHLGPTAARVMATRVILRYLHATHVRHPDLQKWYQPWA